MFQSLLCSKSLLSKINYLDDTVPSYQEWDTSIRLAEYGKFYHIEEALFDYYIGSDDAISKSVEKDFIGRCNILNKFKKEIKECHGNKKYKMLLVDNFINFKEKISFLSLVEKNEIISLYKQNLIEEFGENFEITIEKQVNKLLRQNAIKRGIGFILRIPVRLIGGQDKR